MPGRFAAALMPVGVRQENAMMPTRRPATSRIAQLAASA